VQPPVGDTHPARNGGPPDEPVTKQMSSIISDSIYAAALAVARRQAKDAGRVLDLDAIRLSAEQTDRRTTEIVCNVLLTLGAFTTPDSELTLDAAIASLNIVPGYVKLVRRWFLDLAAVGILARSGELFRAHELPAILLQSSEDNPHFQEISEIIVNVVTGRRHVLEYVFGPLRPAWFSAYTAASYDTDPIYTYQHDITAALVGRIAASALPDKPLRVLEIGAGTGGLTAHLLPLLQPGTAHYVYTDVTRGFIEQAKRRFHAYGDMISYHVYDMNQEPSQSSGWIEYFDIVAAFDVLHCARDLGWTLSALRAVLRPGGLLINEQLTRNRLGHLLIPGIMPGFTDFEDERLSDCRTLIAPPAWRAKLSESGFAECHFLPEDEAMLDQLGHGVIVARNG
jgi:SAM-dependent methyltransferase